MLLQPRTKFLVTLVCLLSLSVGNELIAETKVGFRQFGAMTLVVVQRGKKTVANIRSMGRIRSFSTSRELRQNFWKPNRLPHRDEIARVRKRRSALSLMCLPINLWASMNSESQRKQQSPV